ncbi:MAG: HEPN domain-containing protein [Cyanobacteria bacterium J06554_3]
MSDLLQARILLEAAHRDLKALGGMSDSEIFEDEIFGVHVQQAAEKSLKAWLALLGEIYPYTHNLTRLFKKLKDLNCNVSKYTDLAIFSAFAEQIRYVGMSSEEPPIEREHRINQVNSLYNHVNDLLNSSTARNSS